MLMTFFSDGTVEVELLLKITILLFPVTSMAEVAVPKVVFQAPMASVPAASSVPPLHVLAPPYVMFSCPAPFFTMRPFPSTFPFKAVVPDGIMMVAVSVSITPRLVAVFELST